LVFHQKVGHVPILPLKKWNKPKIKAFTKKKGALRILSGTIFKKAGLSR
jgi:hypothetical protein